MLFFVVDVLTSIQWNGINACLTRFTFTAHWMLSTHSILFFYTYKTSKYSVVGMAYQRREKNPGGWFIKKISTYIFIIILSIKSKCKMCVTVRIKINWRIYYVDEHVALIKVFIPSQTLSQNAFQNGWGKESNCRQNVHKFFHIK